MNDNLVLDFIEREEYKWHFSEADSELLEANIKLFDENKYLKMDIGILQDRINEVIEEIRKRSTKEVADLYISILEGNDK